MIKKATFYITILLILFGIAHNVLASQTIRIGVLAKRGTVKTLERWSPTADYLTQQISDFSFEIVPLNFEDVVEAVGRAQVDFILANPAFYVELEQKYKVSRVATLKNKRLDGTYTTLGGVIFTSKDFPHLDTLAELKGKRFMAVQETSFGGWIVAWREFKEKGIDPVKDFSSLTFGGTHDSVVYAVRNGDVDAGTVRADVLEQMEKEGKISLDDFQVFHEHETDHQVPLPFLHSTREYPEWPIARVQHTDRKLAELVAVKLIEMPETAVAAQKASISGWTIPLNYQQVHECLKVLELPPYDNVGQITLRQALTRMWPVVSMVFLLFISLAFFIVQLKVFNKKINRKNNDLSNAYTELQEAQKQLVQAERMQTIGQLSAGVAHDLNNILSGIVTLPQLLLSQLPDDSPLSSSLKTIERAGNQAALIVQDMLTLSKGGQGIEDIVNLADVVGEYLGGSEYKHLKNTHPGVTVQTEIDNKLYNIQGSRVHLFKMIMNLVTNSADAIVQHGTITIVLKNLSVTTGIQLAIDLPAGDYVHLSIEDDGAGIAQEDLALIFEPFYSKKQLGRKGTGLGMAIIQGTVVDHNGFITVESSVKKGTTVHLFFPKTDKPVTERTILSKTDSQSGAGEHILVIDDTRAQLEIAKALLENLNYQVTTVNNGVDGVEAYKNRKFDLVLLDMMMEPGISGLETTKLLIEVDPEVKILIASGYSVAGMVDESIQLGARGFIQKPYSMNTLSVRIREILQTPNTPLS